MGRSSRLILGVLICFTLLVAWFAWAAFRAAPQIATENLRGAGLTIAAAIEQLAVADASFRSVARYTTPDIAYFALVDRTGEVRFHTNQGLIGEHLPAYSPGSAPQGLSEGRERLGTGEVVYVLRTRVHAGGDELLLTLALHTFRADQVIRRAQTGVTVVTALTVTLWVLTLVLLFMIRRDDLHRKEMSRREELARLGEMAAVMAHEIRNPLAGIKGFAQLVQTATDLVQTHRHADKIVTQSLRMEALVNDLLAFARDDQGIRETVDLSGLLRECAVLMGVEAASQDVTVKVDVPPRCEARVVGDRVVQMVLNLMRNAIQAMPDGGILNIGLRKDGTALVISVTDTGTGIPREHMEKIFEPFWTSKAQGTGLGLTLCRRIAEEHGGSLTVASTTGAGTEVTVTLPVHA